MKGMGRSAVFFALFLTLSLSTAEAQTSKRGGTLTIGFKEEPDRLDDKNVEVLRGEAQRATSFMAGSTWAKDPEPGKLFPKYDVKKGKQLIKEVEKSSGKPIPELVYVSPNRDVYVKIANPHYSAYSAAGLKINLKMVDPTQWLRDRDSGNYDITLAGGGGPGMDPLYQARMFGSTKDVGLVEKDGYNIPRYVNKEYDAIIRKAQSTEDRKVRAKLYRPPTRF